ncbi:glycosyltransferase family 90 protein [Gracilaria domingensis]|nr:glycosyltransferase family 90 protein [Gracilaria domingensis]
MFFSSSRPETSFPPQVSYTIDHIYPSSITPVYEIFNTSRSQNRSPMKSLDTKESFARAEATYRPRIPKSLPLLCSGPPRYSNSILDYGEAPVTSTSAIETAFEDLVARYLAPWIPLSLDPKGSALLQRPITQKLLNSMEVLIRGGAFRVRLAGDGKVRYRVLEHWSQTYRISRMTWTLNLLHDALQAYPELAQIKCEFYVNVADSPRSTVDSMSRDMGGIPVFSFRTSTSYLDVPVPDPVEYGSNGNYVWNTDEKLSYEARIPKLMFRGSSSSLQDYHDHNWLSVPRIRLAALARQHPDLIDAGITKWMKLGKNTSVHEVESSLGTGLSDVLNYENQGKYQFIIDVDGGLGSSRKRGILTSGSVPFFQNSNWYMWYEPLLKPFYHFLPVDTYLQDLLERVNAAKADPQGAKRIIDSATCFGERVISKEGAMLYWKVLLQRYSQLQYDPASGDDEVTPSMCALRPATADGPMGCSDGWYVFNGTVPFGCRYTGAKRHPYQLECWRNIGRGTEFKFTNDAVHSHYNERENQR